LKGGQATLPFWKSPPFDSESRRQIFNLSNAD
jgi:hypothetical protein